MAPLMQVVPHSLILEPWLTIIKLGLNVIDFSPFRGLAAIIDANLYSDVT